MSNVRSVNPIQVYGAANMGGLRTLDSTQSQLKDSVSQRPAQKEAPPPAAAQDKFIQQPRSHFSNVELVRMFIV